MVYRILLELIVSAHFAFMIFIVFGAALALVWRRVIFLHFPALAYGLLNQLFGIICPLSYFEIWLREQSLASGYATGLIEPVLVNLIYPPEWNLTFGFFAAVLLLLFNVSIYAVVFRRWQRRQLI
jgi:hypothetical protein